jgi:hypothetical protein
VSKKSLPFFVPLAVLLFASLACNAISGGGTATGFQATANAAFTQAAAGAATAGALSNSGAATANAAATEVVATANAATGGTTGGDVTATPAAGQATAAATQAGGGGGAVSGGPADIPVVTGDNTVLLATDQVVSYESKAAFDTVVKFYKDEMPKNGWTQNASTSVETANATVLAYTKDSRQAQVSITTNPTSKATVVLITIS